MTLTTLAVCVFDLHGNCDDIGGCVGDSVSRCDVQQTFDIKTPAVLMCWIITVLIMTLSRTENLDGKITAHTRPKSRREKHEIGQEVELDLHTICLSLSRLVGVDFLPLTLAFSSVCVQVLPILKLLL